jgi:hypothetical protein
MVALLVNPHKAAHLNPLQRKRLHSAPDPGHKAARCVDTQRKAWCFECSACCRARIWRSVACLAVPCLAPHAPQRTTTWSARAFVVAAEKKKHDSRSDCGTLKVLWRAPTIVTCYAIQPRRNLRDAGEAVSRRS